MTATYQQAGLSAPPSPAPDPADDRARGFCDPGKRPAAEKVRAILAHLDFRPAQIDTSCVDALGVGAVDGVPVVGQPWIAKGNFYAVRCVRRTR